MRYSEFFIITEIIANPIGQALTYDPKQHRIKAEPKSGLLLDKDSGQLFAFERPACKL